MTSRIWTFGCSFTEGGGLDNPYEDIKGNKDWWKPEYRNAIWPVFLEDELGLQVINKGRSGSGIIAMVYELIFNINKIQKGDRVIISLTSPNRFLHYSNVIDEHEGDKMLGLHHLPVGHHMVNEYLDNRLKLESPPYHNLYDTMSIEQKKIMVEYMLMFNTEKLLPKGIFQVGRYKEELKYTQADAEYHLGTLLVDQIRELFHSRGVHTYLWTHELWGFRESHPTRYDGYFETINKWSNFNHGDQHWSPNGNRRVADFFKWCLNLDRTEIDRELAEEWYSSYNHNHPYIEYTGQNYRLI